MAFTFMGIAEKLSIKAHSDIGVIKQEWVSLQATAADSIFVRYEWHDAALQWPGRKQHTFFLQVCNNESTLAICCLSYLTRKRYGIDIRVLELAHVPDAQLADMLAAPADYAAAATAVADYLQKQSDWDQIVFHHMPATDDKRNAWLEAFRKAGFDPAWHSFSGNPYVRLHNSWADFYAGRSRRLKKGNNLVANKLKRAHRSIELQWLYGPGVTPEQWQTALAEAKHISAISWKRHTETTLDQAGPRAFIERLSKHAIHNDWLSLWLLRLDGAAVAMEYQIIYKGCVHALRADYDNSQSALSPGTYMSWKLLERLFEHDFKRYEMGPGDNPYKQRWLEASLPLGSLTVYHHSVKGRLLNIVEQRLKTAVKALLKKT